MLRKLLPVFVFVACVVSLAGQAEEKKDIGYLVIATETDLILSKKPVPQGRPMMMSREEAPKEEKSAPESQPKEGSGEPAKEGGAQPMVMPSGGTFVTDDGGAIYSIRVTKDTKMPEKLERGTKIVVWYKLDEEDRKIAVRVEKAESDS